MKAQEDSPLLQYIAAIVVISTLVLAFYYIFL